jgi:hypothetical protein
MKWHHDFSAKIIGALEPQEVKILYLKGLI